MSPQMQADAALRPILEIEDLRIAFSGRGGESEAVKGVSLSVAPGEVLGLVGESGSGKTVTMLAAAGLLERNGRIAGGRVHIAGQDV
ncbi:MAG: ATP-binding cassette domain-containing protein, partial [Albimonas sp.]|uniref:ATP-binding cassette domain-containing protein n=1 Tax=Albimonas sp. TaxID=1872425 RepID=UPI004056AC0C